MSTDPSLFSILAALDYAYTRLSSLPRSEAERLLADTLHVSRAYLYAHREEVLSEEAWMKFHALCYRRSQGEPMAYLLGYEEFWSLEFEVNARTLIPRPETELLVELALTKLPKEKRIYLLELGVGSGAIAIALALERPHWQIIGTDFSPDAIEVAKRNKTRHRALNLTLLQSDWCLNLPPLRVDGIVSNPPYIRAGDPHLKALRYEPESALVSGKDGLEAMRKIVHQSRDFLKEGGLLLLEHGYDQASSVRKLLESANYSEITDYCDLANRPRVTTGIFRVLGLSLSNRL
jgi:release factor glutamine methyltransferase